MQALTILKKFLHGAHFFGIMRVRSMWKPFLITVTIATEDQNETHMVLFLPLPAL